MKKDNLCRTDAIYARQSIEKKDSISLDSQIQLCQRAADPDAVVYQDSGYSGKNTQRPAFSQLMDDIRAGKIKRVFCYRLDRISRSVYDFSLLWKTFDEYDVVFSSVTESFDTNTPMGRAMVLIIMTFAQLERETIVSRYTANRYARSNSGVWAGGKAPYGFRITKTQIDGKTQSVLEPIPEQLEIVARLFAEYAAGTASLYSLAKALNEDGIPTEGRASTWNPHKIRRMLRNPVYVRANVDVYSYYYPTSVIANDVYEFDGSHACYLTVQGGKSSFGTQTLSIAYHKGIVPSETFLLVQKSLSENKQIKNGVRSQLTWLSGLLKCSGCGGRITAFQHQKGFVYFQCANRFRARGSCDTTIHGNSGPVESFVADAIQQRMDSLSDRPQDTTIHDTQLNNLKIKLIENEQQTANLIEAIKLGGAAAMRAIKNELDNLELEHEQLVSEITKLQPAHRLPVGIPKFDFAALDYDSKRDIARMLIDRVIVGDDNPIQIVWK